MRDYFMRRSEQPRLIDRMPEGDFLMRLNVLEVARETSGMMYANKVPYRDFISQEFLLGQAKSYGINFQRPVYVFANENSEWGAMVYVSDSSKIFTGITRLRAFAEIKDSVYFDQKIYYNEKENLYLTYDKTWLFIYKGDEFKQKLFSVLNARRERMNPAWRAFLKEKKFKNQKLVVYSNWRSMKDYGIEKAIFG